MSRFGRGNTHIARFCDAESAWLAAPGQRDTKCYPPLIFGGKTSWPASNKAE
jgi:hypothetical protein